MIIYIYHTECLIPSRKAGVLDKLWELIIDWIYYEWVEAGWDWETRRTLFTCSLVDRAWKRRTKLHLTKFTEIYNDQLAFFSLRSITAGLRIIKRFGMTRISSFMIQHQYLSTQLDYLSIEELNLGREDEWFFGMPLSLSVRTLKLINLQPCELSRLIRFIRSFISLSNLELSFAHSEIDQEYQVIHSQSLINTTRSIRSLHLSLIPGISMLLDELLKERSLLIHLQTLELDVHGAWSNQECRAIFEGVERVLDRCRASVEDFRLYLDRVPIVEDVYDLGTLQFTSVC